MYLYTINFISVTILLCIISKSSANDKYDSEKMNELSKEQNANTDQYNDINKKPHTSLQTLLHSDDTFKEFISCPIQTDNKLFKNIKFQYWSQSLKNQNPSSIDIDFSNVKPLLDYWEKDNPVKVLIHGCRSASGAYMVKDAYVESTSTTFNVITMDWGETSLEKNYVKAASLSLDVGKYLGYFLVKLVKHKITEPCHIHVIGHNLGAHIAGVSGKTFKYYINQQINHITGLNPSRLTFAGSSRLSWNKCGALERSDAEFVDVIHTAGGLFDNKDRIGHADFYPNDGVSPQPNCKKSGILKQKNCSRFSGYLYYSESVKNRNSFESMRCNSMTDLKNGECDANVRNYMGNDVNFKIYGKFNLETNPDFPYSKALPLPKPIS